MGPSARDVARDIGPTEVADGVVGAIFAMTGPVAVILTAAAAAGLGPDLVSSWIFGVFVLNGVLTVVASWAYRQPLAFFWTIPGTALVGQAATHLPWSDVLGAYLLTGVLLVLLGLFGRVDRLMAALPTPVVMAMVAGVFLGFGTGLVAAVGTTWRVAVPMVAAFVVAALVRRIGALVPPVVAAVLVGALAVVVTGTGRAVAWPDSPFAAPVLQSPTFSWAAIAELVLPLAVTVVFVQNAQGMAVLAAAGHRAPMRFVTVACGLWSLLAAAVGAVSSCLTGPTNALLTASGRRERHYAAGIVCGIVATCFGVMAPVAVALLGAAPAAFIAVLAGLALLRALQGAFATAFSGPDVTAPLLTFLVTASGVTVLHLGAPFWGLVTGVVATWLAGRAARSAQRQPEPDDRRQQSEQ
ncbi:benzoate/H(+) symporter BenE family transporter [Nocardioides ginsengisoli]|uniref:Benzoate/H(+) symporter BenE family transporter n=1 Tax=Nocardioides ginsengisoli TaxID=363868 RepID=A0ABW3W0Q4_9ACTN